MLIELKRFYHPFFTFGELHIDSKFFCYSLERAWANNQKSVSCIPEGTYKLKRRYTQQRGVHILVDQVPNRDYILIHPMNDVSTHDSNNKVDSLGCIGLADRLIFANNDMKGLFSKPAVRRFTDLVLVNLEAENVYLVIKKFDNVRIIPIEK
jgi:Family of unknown function (DUF5675)